MICGFKFGGTGIVLMLIATDVLPTSRYEGMKIYEDTERTNQSLLQ